MPYSIHKWSILRAVFRSFFIQGSWHYKGMLNLGFLFALVPFLRVTRSTPLPQEIINRHSGYFNTHPYMSSFIIGAIARMEEDMIFRHKGAEASILQLKNILSRALGAVGDRLFWKFLRPFSASIGLIIILLFKNFQPYNVIAGIILFFLIFNVPHLWYRVTGMFQGYKYGAILPLHLNVRKIEKPVQIIQSIGLFILGMLLWTEGYISFEEGTGSLAAFLAGSGLSWALQATKSLPSNLSLFLPIILGFALGTIILVFS